MHWIVFFAGKVTRTSNCLLESVQKKGLELGTKDPDAPDAQVRRPSVSSPFKCRNAYGPQPSGSESSFSDSRFLSPL
jgi:hypothetical protein